MNRRICHVFTFAELENIMQKLTGDDTVSIGEVYPVLSMYSEEENICYDTDEILDHLGKHLKRNLSWAFPIYDAQEVYIIESNEIEETLPLLTHWAWEDCVTIKSCFGRHTDENGEEFDLYARYQTDCKVWDFTKVYEDNDFCVSHEDCKKSMRKQVETILRQEGIIV